MSGSTNSSGGPGKFLKNVLGIIFFIILIIGGIFIAIYGARTIPGLFSSSNGASVYSSSIFHTSATTTPATTTTTTGTATTTQNSTGGAISNVLSNGFSTPTLPQAPSIKDPGTTTTTGTTKTSTGTTGTTRTVTTGHYVQVPTQTQYYGLPDLQAHIIEIGYLDSRDNFIESDSVPSGRIGVVHFAIINNGTNASGSWKLEAELPTNQSYQSGYQASIPPGGTSIGELNFDNADRGNNQDISIMVDYNNRIQESNERNNEDSAEIDIR